jgi:hypothetical protein
MQTDRPTDCSQVRGSHEARKGRRQLVHKQGKADQQAAAEKAAIDKRMEVGESGHMPKPSVYEVVAFLGNEWVWRMPKEACPLCGLTVLPAEPPSVAERDAAEEARAA